MCTQNAYLIVVFYMRTFCLWKWNSPRRMSNLALSIHQTPLHFSNSCSRKTLSLSLPHRREVEWQDAEQSSSEKNSTLWPWKADVCRGQLTRSPLGNAEDYGHFDVALSTFLSPEVEPVEKTVWECVVCSSEDGVKQTRICACRGSRSAVPLTSFDFRRRKGKAHLIICRIFQWRVSGFIMELRACLVEAKGGESFKEGIGHHCWCF